jgi:hypothetical protein
MKKLCIILIALFVAGSAMAQTDQPCSSCLPEGITFSTQSQIDSFPLNYPNCTEIEGDVTINGDDISSLDALNLITNINGDVKIISCALTNLSGLEGLSSIGGDLITLVGLSSLSGLEELTLIGGNLRILGSNLTSLSGLEGLTFIGSLSIGSNYNLTSLSGLEGVNSIPGGLSIWDNQALTNLIGLEVLNSIGDNLGIWWNHSLTSMSAIENINLDSIIWLRISDNILLSECDVQNICNFLAAPNGTVIVEDNATGCNSPEEVLDSCEAHAGIIDISIADKLSIYPNPAHAAISIELPTQPSKNTSLTISNTNGQQLITQPIVKPQTEIDISNLPTGIYIVKVWNDKEVMVLKVVKR